MNLQEADVLLAKMENPSSNQRVLASCSGHSLGIVNRSVRNLMNIGYLDENGLVTTSAYEYVKKNSPKRAIILAAGYGMRMVPINEEVPKGLLEVNTETLVERLIRQLHEVGITDISVVVGYKKEMYEFLIDDYGVELIINHDYGVKNNLHSLNLAAKKLENCYIVPCDIWCKNNPFRKRELYSWYMVSDQITKNSSVRVNRKQELIRKETEDDGNSMIGIAYLCCEESRILKNRLESFDRDSRYDRSFWEDTLFEGNRMILPARVLSFDTVQEINTYEQLRDLDERSRYVRSRMIDRISQILAVSSFEIVDIQVLKKGMTNRSFRFRCREKEYIARIPGEGTDRLINRKQEKTVYDTIIPAGFCDSVVYMDDQSGLKISEYIADSRVCDSTDFEDVKKCMEILRRFHQQNLSVDHIFDPFEQLLFYEQLWDGKRSVYRDYEKTKANVFSLKEFLDSIEKGLCLAHIDAVPDNFLFTKEGNVRMIDWEYAGMQDPHIDLAMFAIYSYYSRKQIDDLIDLYFDYSCDRKTRIKIYAYVSICGLLWSNWCEYKRNLGIEFGEYSLRQYRYAKEYYKIVMDEIGAGL